jgi:hypothetical protein
MQLSLRTFLSSENITPDHKFTRCFCGHEFGLMAAFDFASANNHPNCSGQDAENGKSQYSLRRVTGVTDKLGNHATQPREPKLSIVCSSVAYVLCKTVHRWMGQIPVIRLKLLQYPDRELHLKSEPQVILA